VTFTPLGNSTTYLPNMLNMLVVTTSSGGRIIAPVPCFEPFEASLWNSVKDIGYGDTNDVWLIDSREAHAEGGEVHCATNVVWDTP